MVFLRALARRHRFLPLLVVYVLIFLLAAAGIVLIGLRDRPGHADLAVVLGNEVLPSGRPSARLAARLDRALELYRAGGCDRILVSGGLGASGYDEAKVMDDYLVAQGVPGNLVLEDNAGKDTYSTALNTRRVLCEHGWRSVCVVTQYYHVPRAAYAMRRCGVRPVFSAHAHYFEWRDPFSIGREFFGLIEYAWRSYPADSAPSPSHK